MRMIWASTVSAPTRVARKVKLPVLLIVPPTTSAPAAFATGTGSPVIIDSSTIGRALDDLAVDRDPLAGTDLDDVAGAAPDRAAPRTASPSRTTRAVFGLQAHQALDRLAGAALGAASR